MNEHTNHQQQTSFTKFLNEKLVASPDRMTTIAGKAGITLQYLSMLKTGRRLRPSRKTVEDLAEALGANLNEALSAANLPHPRRTDMQLVERSARLSKRISYGMVSVNWRCQVKVGQVSLLAQVKQIAEKTFQVIIKQIAEEEHGQPEPCHVQWFMNGEEHAAMSVTAEGAILTLQEGEHEFRCQWENSEEEAIFYMDFRVSDIE